MFSNEYALFHLIDVFRDGFNIPCAWYAVRIEMELENVIFKVDAFAIIGSWFGWKLTESVQQNSFL